MAQVLVVCLLFIGAVLAQEKAHNLQLPDPECGPCIREECPPDVDHLECEAGVVKDQCGCCDECAKKEFEKCEHPQSRGSEYQGKCGEHLQCKLRQDLAKDDKPEAICYCTMKETLCGSDGISYQNLCQLGAAVVRTGQQLTVASKGPCKSAPTIVSRPEDTKDVLGSNVALVCEATGSPIPNVKWVFTRVDGKTTVLPSDDLHISVNMRGGPEKWQITGWLQIMDMTKKHEGDYTCITENPLGMTNSTARVIVADDENEILVGKE